MFGAEIRQRAGLGGGQVRRCVIRIDAVAHVNEEIEVLGRGVADRWIGSKLATLVAADAEVKSDD